MPVQFAVLASGSRGNAALVRGRGAGVLIDAGIGPRALGKRLESVGAGWEQVACMVLTHTHGDHIDTGSFGELARRRVPIHCHAAHRDVLAADAGFQRLEEAGLVSCYDDRPLLLACGARLEPIPLRHDAGPTFGFRIEVSLERRGRSVSVGYLADSGCWSASMVEQLADVAILGVEFNHDEAMQRASPRSRALIARNLGDRGHLSNRQGAELVGAVLARSRRGALRHLVLLHLSQQCNDPELALAVARDGLKGTGDRVAVHAARQNAAFPNLWVSSARGGARAGAAAAGWVASGAEARPRERRGVARRPSRTVAADHGSFTLAGLGDEAANEGPGGPVVRAS